ncbi:AMP-binding protein [bacterium]|nr:AMP-binding protein [bacterium]MCB2202361.1 AMP-binding protein [bacterium]
MGGNTYNARSSATRLFDIMEAAAGRNPDKLALVGYGGKGENYTYRQVIERARALAAVLTDEPYRELEYIGLLSENRPEWPIVYLAIGLAGKTVVPIDANLKPSEIARIAGHARLNAVVCSARCDTLLDEIKTPLRVIPLDPPSSHHDDLPHEYDQPFETLTSQPSESISPPKTPSETAALIYTSGTTGAPKAVMLTHTNLVSNVQQAVASLHFNHEDTFLSILPLHHTFESTCGFMAAMSVGATIVYARSLKSKEIVEDIGANRASVMCGVPLLYEKMYQSIQRKIDSAPLPRRLLFRTLYRASALSWKMGGKAGVGLFRSVREKGGLGSIRLFVSGGAAIPPQIAEFFNLIGFTFLQGYGMTECSPVISVNRPDDIEFGSVGPALADEEVRIDSPDSSGVGEIVVRGPNTTPGYKDNPEATAELLRDGWLHTGDLGRIDERGHIWITGRAKNVIVSAAGKNIYPEEIEEKLVLTPSIGEAVVFGRKKTDRQGEEIRAIVVPDLDYFTEVHSVDAASPDIDAIRAVVDAEIKRVNGEVADYKRIAGFEIQLEELQKTSTKKVKRFLYK